MVMTEIKPDYLGDSQRVELLGRNRLVEELLRGNLEVALPLRDRGIDLIAYADMVAEVAIYTARPIQLKAAWSRSFIVEKKYEKFPGLILAYVWNLGETASTVTYALEYMEALQVAEKMGWTKTDSWIKHGAYSTTNPGARLTSLLEPYRMTPDRWWNKVVKC